MKRFFKEPFIMQKTWFGIPYRWQIWWKFGKYEAWNLIHDLQLGTGVAMAIAAAIGVFDVIAGVLFGIFMAGQMGALASAFSEALDHSSGETLIFYIDDVGNFSLWILVRPMVRHWAKQDRFVYSAS